MPNITPDWVQDAIFYQIFPDRFAMSKRVPKPANLQAWSAPPTYHDFKGGDLLGVAEKLDYLIELGINAIYFNPVFSSAANHRYHTYDYFQIDPILGGRPAFDELLQEAHRRDIRVVLDGVFNHASRGFFQFNHLLENNSSSPYIDWFHVNGWPMNAYNEHERPNYAAWWGLHALPKFNISNKDVREFLWSVATYWIEQGIDGWRLDVPSEIDDDPFWREFRRRCKEINPDCYLIGELWGRADRWLQGDQFDGQMNYPLTRAILGFFGGHNLNQSDTVHTGLDYINPIQGNEFASVLNQLHHRYDSEIVFAQLNVLSTHDTPRLFTIANRDLSTVRLSILCQMTLPGAPSIYYGDEIGLPGGRDPDSRRAFPWEDRTKWNMPLLEEVRRCTALRHSTTALRRGDFSILHATDAIVVYCRRYGEQIAVIAFNSDVEESSFTLDEEFPFPLPEKLNDHGRLLETGVPMAMGPRSGRIWINQL